MLCSECQDLLSEYIDGELSAKRRSTVEAHLRTCPPCQALADDLARIIEASQNLPLVGPGPRVWAEILSRVSTDTPATAGWWRRICERRVQVSASGRQLLALAATLVIAVGLIGLVHYASPGALPVVDVSWAAFGDGSQHAAATPLAATAPAADDLARVKGAIADMQQRVAARRASWSADLQASFDGAVAAADARIAAAQRVFASEPTPAAQARLATAYQEKLQLLEVFTRMGAS